ncbi:MAG: hypothetical protein FWC89_12240 [Defluviitaleaceae bacterium]|nr:hypothetical protein [Defluviitaleaceae bacterium]
MQNFNCAVCGNTVVPDDFGLCNICYWEHDPVQETDHDYRGGANKRSLNEAKLEWHNHNAPSIGQNQRIAV